MEYVVVEHIAEYCDVGLIDVAGWDLRGYGPLKFLENIVILCFERRFSKQNSVIRLKSSILARPNFLAPINFWAGYPTGRPHAALLETQTPRTTRQSSRCMITLFSLPNKLPGIISCRTEA